MSKKQISLIIAMTLILLIETITIGIIGEEKRPNGEPVGLRTFSYPRDEQETNIGCEITKEIVEKNSWYQNDIIMVKVIEKIDVFLICHMVILNL